MGKRETLEAAFSLLGILRLRWWLLPSRLYCFNYHRVGNSHTTDFDRNTFSCTASQLDEHVGFLKDKFEVVTLTRVTSLIGRGWLGRKPPALITFDDGYVDNYTQVFPILKKHGVTAAFFLPTAFIGTSQIPWWDEIAWLVRGAAGRQIALEGAKAPLAINPVTCEQDIQRVMSFVKARRVPLQDQVEEIRQACGGVRVAGLPDAERLFLNWDNAREMRAAGMDVGSHTHTHRLLAGLSETEQQTELAVSKEIAEGELRSPVTSVAYPVGSTSAYTPQTCELARRVGYSLGFNFVRDGNRLPLDRPLDVKRLSVSGNVGVEGLRSVVCFPRLFR